MGMQLQPNPNVPEDCAMREAQAMIEQRIIIEELNAGREVGLNVVRIGLIIILIPQIS